MQQNRRILIVDDQQDLREQLAKLLLRSGHGNETSSLVMDIRSRLGIKESGGDNAPRSAADVEYEVDTVGQGEEAFKMVQRALAAKRPYAIMFTDMRMPPGWDGLETSKRVREIDKNIEIVIMTAFADHDQKKLAEAIGTPHKLLYIKKPFQTEEINQLALALSSKWNFEETERLRKEWLETLIRCLGKVKTSVGGNLADVYSLILKSLLSFCGSSRGLIATCDGNGEWVHESLQGLEKFEADGFLQENSDRLRDSRTTLSFANKYVLPLRRDNNSVCVAAIFDLEMQNDPEWYKMLSLLVMTAGEVLNSALITGSSIRKEQITTLTRAVNKISKLELEAYSGIRQALDRLEGRLAGDPDLASIRTLVSGAERRLNRIHDVLLLGESAPNASSVPPASLRDAVTQACEEAATFCAGFPFTLEWSGDDPAAVAVPADLLRRAFRNLALNSFEAAHEAGREGVAITATVENLKNAVTVSFKDNGPGVAEKVLHELFDPFASGSDHKLGIGLAAARLIFERFNGSIFYDVKNTAGAGFNIRLPLAS